MNKKLNQHEVLQEALLECAQAKYGDTMTSVADFRMNTPATMIAYELVDKLHQMGFKIIKS